MEVVPPRSANPALSGPWPHHAVAAVRPVTNGFRCTREIVSNLQVGSADHAAARLLIDQSHNEHLASEAAQP